MLDPEGYPKYVSLSIASVLGVPHESFIAKLDDSGIIHAEDAMKIG